LVFESSEEESGKSGDDSTESDIEPTWPGEQLARKANLCFLHMPSFMN
jgi:hypothetical protein